MTALTNPERYTDTDLPRVPNGPRVYVNQGGQFGMITAMLAEIGFRKAASVEDADLIVYGGGSDVSPDFYGQKAIAKCGYPDRVRDLHERQVFERARELGIPQMGICRGAQFLHVMCGGILWQHVNGHTRDHDMFDMTSNKLIKTSSTHHQMMQFNDKMNLIACTSEDVANYFEDAITTLDFTSGDVFDPQIEVEVCSYEDEKVLCIQGHPEYGPIEFTSWSMHLLNDWFAVNRKKEYA
jgi:gamma-glutamyl-gamma-aminobutyrate hydrolase PuuD